MAYRGRMDEPSQTSHTGYRRRVTSTRRAIVQAAGELLLEHGEAGVTIEAISYRAEVAKQTIYNRVGNRAAVLAAVAEDAISANELYLNAAYDTPGSVFERAQAVADAYLRFAVDQPQAFRLISFPPPGKGAGMDVVSFIEMQNAKLAELIDEGVRTGVIATGVKPGVIAMVLWRSWDGVISLLHRPDDLQASEETVRGLLLTLSQVIQFGLGSGERP